MISFIIVWLVLLVVCAIVGVNVLQLLDVHQFSRVGDRLVIAVWLGIAVFSLLLLTASLVLALSPLAGIVLAAILVLISLWRRETRREIRAFSRALSPLMAIGAFVLALGGAIYETQPVRYYDTGLYHFGLIRWLSRFGTVPGLALIHFRFGFASSWFALAAPFNAGSLEARTTTLLNGLALLLAAFHFLLCASRCLTNRALLPDWIIVSASAFFIPSAVYRILFISSSPDAAVMILTVVVAWTIIVMPEHPRPKKTSKFAPDASILPFVLSMAALTIKVSALALVIVSTLFFVYHNGLRLRSLLSLGTVGLALLVPMIAYQTMTSGCPLFPTGVLCANLPWSMDAQQVRHMFDTLPLWTRWGGPPPPDAGRLDWLWRGWLTQGTTPKVVMAILFSTVVAAGGFLMMRLGRAAAKMGRWLTILGITASAFLLMFRANNLLFVYAVVLALATYKRKFPGKNWLLGIGLTGVSVALYGAPSITYNFGYIAVLVSSAVTSYHGALGRALLPVSSALQSRKSTYVLPLLLIAGGLSVGLCRILLTNQPPVRSPLVDTEEGFSLFIPPRLPRAVVIHQRINDIDFYQPIEGDQCWAAELPCANGELDGDIRLRDPARGISAGFVRK